MKKLLCIFFMSCLIGTFTFVPAYAGYFGGIWYPYTGTHWEPGINTAESNVDESGNFTVPVAGEATWSLGPGWASLTDLPDVDGLPYEVWAVNEALNWWADVSGFTNLGLTNGSSAPFGAPSNEGGAMGDIRFGWGYENSGYAQGLHDWLKIPPPNPPGSIILALTANPNTEEACPNCFEDYGVYGTIGGDIRLGGFDPIYREWVDEPGDVIGDGQYDFFTNVLHEAGHALGLDHPYDVELFRPSQYITFPSLMELYIDRGGAMRALSKEDIQHIQYLYGPGDFTPASELPDDYLYEGPDEDPGMIYHESYTSQIWGVDVTYSYLQNQGITSFWSYEQLTLTIANRTGETWTDFHFYVEGEQPSAGFAGEEPLSSFPSYSGPGTATFSDDAKELDVVGLSIPHGDIYTFTVWVQSSGGVASLFGLPTVDSGPVLEPGDFDGDGNVDYDDLFDHFLSAYGTHTGDPGYVPAYDLNEDGSIDMLDYLEWYVCYMNAN